MKPAARSSTAQKIRDRNMTILMSNNKSPRRIRPVPWEHHTSFAAPRRPSPAPKREDRTRIRRERMKKQQQQWDIYEKVLTGEIQADGAIIQQELTALKERLRANELPIPVLLENMIKNTPLPTSQPPPPRQAPPPPPPIVAATEEARIMTDHPTTPPSSTVVLPDNRTKNTPPVVNHEIVEDTAATDDGDSMTNTILAALVARWKDNSVHPWEEYKDPGQDEPGASPPHKDKGPTMSEWVKSVPTHGHQSTCHNHHPDHKHRSWDMWIRNWPQHAATA